MPVRSSTACQCLPALERISVATQTVAPISTPRTVARYVLYIRPLQDQEEAAKLAKLQKELRGKDYIYDGDGKIITIDKVNVNKLPSQMCVLLERCCVEI